MPPTPMVFPKNALMEWNENKVSDHNRSDLSVNVERIETTKRMANGTLRKYVIADKRKFSVSWEGLPDNSEWTVDGFWGGRDIEAFYNDMSGPFTLKVTHGDGTIHSFLVVFTDFSKNIEKRGAYDFWSVDVGMEEV